tara:strand:+ start:321 stop:509 length:189 start_codon:yes stop_codon:yes gene_type:complete
MNKRERSITCKNCGHDKFCHTFGGSGGRRIEVKCFYQPYPETKTCAELGNCKRFHSIEGDYV